MSDTIVGVWKEKEREKRQNESHKKAKLSTQIGLRKPFSPIIVFWCIIDSLPPGGGRERERALVKGGKPDARAGL